MILVDANILIDLLTGREPWVTWSSQQIATARELGQAFITDVAFAEVCGGFEQRREADRFLESSGVVLASLPRDAVWLAGKAFRAYRANKGPRESLLPDFLIGAHAQAIGCPLLTRDVRRYRTYFPDVRLITP